MDQHSNLSALRQASHPWQWEEKGCGVIKDALVGTYIFLYFIIIISPRIYVNLLGTLDTNESIRLGIVEHLQSFWLWEHCPWMLEFPKIPIWKLEMSGSFTPHPKGRCQWLVRKYKVWCLCLKAWGWFLVQRGIWIRAEFGTSPTTPWKLFPLPRSNVSTPLSDPFLNESRALESLV